MLTKIKGLENFCVKFLFKIFQNIIKKWLTRQSLYDKIGLISMVFVVDHWTNGKKWIFQNQKIKKCNSTRPKVGISRHSRGTSPQPKQMFFRSLDLFSRKRECYCVGAHSSREMRNRQRRLGAAYDSGMKPGLRIPLYIPCRIQIPAN